MDYNCSTFSKRSSKSFMPVVGIRTEHDKYIVASAGDIEATLGSAYSVQYGSTSVAAIMDDK